MEGTYKWVVFLPAKTTGVGALNRYYGVFQDGELKLRGIELRKHDTCPLVNRVQAAILEEMSKAGNATEFHERLPRALDILRGAARALREGLVPIHDLVLTKSVTREIEEYSVFTNVVAALKQMEARGYAVHPGESIRFAITRQSSRDPEAKVRVAEFLRGDERPDVQEYLKLLARSGETLFAPFGHTEESLLRDLSTTAVAASVPALGESLARVGVGYRAHA
jgi:DNA polymerase elongation subunit (family B)